jgi:hypothetical protein
MHRIERSNIRNGNDPLRSKLSGYYKKGLDHFYSKLKSPTSHLSEPPSRLEILERDIQDQKALVVKELCVLTDDHKNRAAWSYHYGTPWVQMSDLLNSLNKALETGFIGHSNVDLIHESIIRIVMHSRTSRSSDLLSETLDIKSLGRIKERLQSFKSAIQANDEFEATLEKFLETLNVEHFPAFARRLQTLAFKLGGFERLKRSAYERYLLNSS